MGKGYIGESRGERAMNKMTNWLEREDRNRQRNRDGEDPFKGNALVEQLKEQYGKDWKQALEEIRREHRDPAYKEKKEAARKDAKARWTALTRRERDAMEITEERWVQMQVNQWRKDYKG